MSLIFIQNMNAKHLVYAIYIKDLCTYVLVILGVLIFKEFLFAPVLVNGDSMYSTLHENDVMILNKLSKKDINRFDIVVIKYKEKYLIKRVIGLPGDIIYIDNNKLYINGKEVDEPFLGDDVKTGNFLLQFPVPEDSYFVMGDNREVSLDSRSLGCFSIDKIEGKANLTIFPLNRLGVKE